MSTNTFKRAIHQDLVEVAQVHPQVSAHFRFIDARGTLKVDLVAGPVTRRMDHMPVCDAQHAQQLVNQYTQALVHAGFRLLTTTVDLR